MSGNTMAFGSTRRNRMPNSVKNVITTGNTIAIAMEGGLLAFGDGEGALPGDDAPAIDAFGVERIALA